MLLGVGYVCKEKKKCEVVESQKKRNSSREQRKCVCQGIRIDVRCIFIVCFFNMLLKKVVFVFDSIIRIYLF